MRGESRRVAIRRQAFQNDWFTQRSTARWTCTSTSTSANHLKVPGTVGEVTLPSLPSSYPTEETAPHTGSRSRSVRLSLLPNASKAVPVRVDLFLFLLFPRSPRFPCASASMLSISHRLSPIRRAIELSSSRYQEDSPVTSSVDFKVRERTSVIVVDELCDSQVFLFCSTTVFEKTNRGDRPQPEQPCRRIKVGKLRYRTVFFLVSSHCFVISFYRLLSSELASSFSHLLVYSFPRFAFVQSIYALMKFIADYNTDERKPRETR